MSTPNKCPQCGAEENGDCEGEGTLYSCESYEPTGEQFVQSDLCHERSARQTAEEELAKVVYERDSWERTAKGFHGGLNYYRGLLVQIGEMLGPDAKTQDDGGVVPDVLVAKVLELVQKSVADLAAAKAEASKLADDIDLMRDDFKRIQARIGEQYGRNPKGLFWDIMDLCERAIVSIPQRVSVIQQRDAAEKRAREAGTACANPTRKEARSDKNLL